MIGKDLHKAVEILKAGGLVAIPTETVYGLAANALDVKAVSRIFEAKNRPFFDPLICHFAGLSDIVTRIQDLSVVEIALLERFSPGPLTLLLPRPTTIPELVTSGSSLVGVRIPNHPLALEVLRNLNFPLAAPSANPFGYISPTRPEHVEAQLGSRIDYTLDGGPCEVGVESTVVQVIGSKGVVYRPGGISLEQLQTNFPDLDWAVARPATGTTIASPGTLDTHYAPKKPLRLLSNLDDFDGDEGAFLIAFDTFIHKPVFQQILLAPSATMAEAAANLFSALHQADDSLAKSIEAVLLPETGLGRAINDRLRRAAAKRP